MAESTVLPDSLGLTRTAFSVGGRVAYHTTALTASAEAGLHATGTGAAFPGGAVEAAWEPGRFLRLFAEAGVSGQPLSWVDTHGWGGWVIPLEADPEARTQLLRAGVRLRGGVFDLEVTPFLHQTTDAFDLFVIGEGDTLAVRGVGEAVRWAGVSVDAGFRRDAARGIYLTATPTLFQYAGEAGTADARRVRESLPALFVRGRAGLRYLLFKGDLDMDLYVQARFWTPFRSRVLHPQTGLLAIPLATGTEVASSVAADVVLEAGVRDATIFVAFDNLLSGTAFLGNQLVPDYPLPEQRFRLAVYWPIFD